MDELDNIDDLLGSPDELAKELNEDQQPERTSQAATDEVSFKAFGKEPETLSPDDVQEAPEKGVMPPEAQHLTYMMARNMQAAEAERLVRAGWIYGEKHDAALRESPALRPFEGMDYEQKRPYLDASANAVMVLLDGDFTLQPSQDPQIPLPDGIRKDAETLLVSRGRSAEDARAAIDAIEAAGYSVEKAPSKDMRKMEAYFKMAAGGIEPSSEDARTLIRSTVNMALKEGIAYDEINAFIKAKNDTYGVTAALISPESEARRMIAEMTAEYERSFDETMASSPSLPVTVPGLRNRILSDGDFLRVYGDAVRAARKKVVPKIEELKDPGLRKALYEKLDAFEHGEFFERRRKETSGLTGSWKTRLDQAVEASDALNKCREDYRLAMERWTAFKWYEKIFIPKPLNPVEEIRTLEQRRNDAVAALSGAWKTDHASGLLRIDEESGCAVQASLSLSEKGRPVLSLKRMVAGELVEESKLAFLRDGSCREVLSSVNEGASSKAKMQLTKMRAVFRINEEELKTELSSATVLARQYRLVQEQKNALALKYSLLQIREKLEDHRMDMERESQRSKEERRRMQKDRKDAEERKEKMPTLHPHLAGDITPKDVEILKAYRLQGGRGKDLQNIIDSLKEKKEIVVEGTVTHRRTHSWDPPTVPTDRVYIGLRFAADGHIKIFNPVSGRDMGDVRTVLSMPHNLDFGGTAKKNAAARRAEAEKAMKSRTRKAM